MEPTFFGVRIDQYIDTVQTIGIIAAIAFSVFSFRQLRMGRALLVDVIGQQTRVLASLAKRIETLEKRGGVLIGNDVDELAQLKRFVDAMRAALDINTNDNSAEK